MTHLYCTVPETLKALISSLNVRPKIDQAVMQEKAATGDKKEHHTSVIISILVIYSETEVLQPLIFFLVCSIVSV